MIFFQKPTNLDGSKLRQEIIEAGVSIVDSFESVFDNGEGLLGLDIHEKDQSKVAEIVAAHNGLK